jgi:hypothetical protein
VIREDVVLTASHCAYSLMERRARGLDLIVTNDPVLDPAACGCGVEIDRLVSKSAVAEIVLNPAFDNSFQDEVSALRIAGGLSGIASNDVPALPAAGRAGGDDRRHLVRPDPPPDE